MGTVYAKESDGPPICPVLIQVGSAERLRDEGIYFAMQRFKNSDCRLEMYQDMINIFQMFMPSKYISGVALRRFGQFVQDVTAHEAFVISPITRYVMRWATLLAHVTWLKRCLIGYKKGVNPKRLLSTFFAGLHQPKLCRASMEPSLLKS
ncbi:hypothetical protein SeMB42_g05675 [Synchytrium endobioticum]|uniref:Uncharacterized protein n=1 Tax=Synchytrium endobioticum TaxID=286115 RepID=A0A507CQ39_9FUNG|nr:hypothetical protein SeMB42_g05675 [Synchytrium endobioticum]